MQKIRKILRVVSEKTALPANPPIITSDTDFIEPGWRQSKKMILIEKRGWYEEACYYWSI